ncbi:MAG: NAD-dependent succinate-semialdehyde dehydrogenase [Bacillota bacterium]|jgi:succinate-semialdehyde dehydrogenase/glutarate-semialdehyde dehydrogenase
MGELTSAVLGGESRMWIGGRWVEAVSGEFVDVTDPATGEVVGRVPKGGGKDAARAIDAAFSAFPGWSRRTGAERASVLKRWAEAIRNHRQEISRILTLEQGKPLAESLEEADGAADFVEWYAEEAKRICGETLPGSRGNQRILVIRQPVGVAALITPWNYPATMVTRKMAAALAAGCTVVLKPASQTPLTAVALLKLLEEAGLPPGAANLVTGEAGAIGREMMADPRVRKVSFTGSTETGKKLIRASAERVKRLSLELGGNAPLIVFPDADLERAVEATIGNKFENAGQMCNGINVLYVHESIVDRFSERLVSRVQSLRVGRGTEPGVRMGPLIDERNLRKVEALVEDAVRKGARVLTGGCRLTGEPHRSGTFYAPTVIGDVTLEMRLVHEEIFGPVAPVVPFREEGEVLARVNAAPYGLAAYVFTRDVGRVFRMAENLEFGMVAVNGTSLSVPQAPFGGIKESGQGREGGRHGMEEFLHLKYISLNL